jgi:hypothetical protein
MAELSIDAARSAARTALGYSQAFDGKGIDWGNGQPWPHRMELAQALDWITELGAMVLNLADRADTAALLGWLPEDDAVIAGASPTQTPALPPILGPLVEDAARECLAALAGVDTYDTNLCDHGEAWAAIEAFADKVRAAERAAPVRLAGYPAVPGSGPTGKTCRTCEHRATTGCGARRYQKCTLMRPHWTRGAGTDIKASSPACSRYAEATKDAKP